MRITVDSHRCVGAGQCVLSAPEVFDQDEDGLVTVLTHRPGAEEQQAVRRADTLCPSRAITVHED
ncbi:ferredoxin [Kitasatospora sp. GP82]|uniref:ferredoxin n=1 Tax=Kitasatospora sp. GP82 TaxID=3035089 RepID=UPI002473FFD5|nr:ferredoxin [Kitasatospora sp. GP82]MDH6125724.1 ferredoxin [Kitasatospora sp. GP82]